MITQSSAPLDAFARHCAGEARKYQGYAKALELTVRQLARKADAETKANIEDRIQRLRAVHEVGQ